jgi:hypothetical protein
MPVVEFYVEDRRAPRREAAPGILAEARRLAEDAKRNTPRRTGDMARGWRAAADASGNARVINDVPYARFVEYGTRHMAPRAPLGRALANARARM